MKKAVFLDRDGVINQTLFRDGKPRAPDRVEDFKFFSGVKEAIQLLKEHDFLTIVVTNQPDVSRGWQIQAVVEAMNQIVKSELQVDEVLVCYHDDHHDCECRKPKPGMLQTAAETWNIDLTTSYMIGDRAGDIAAGKAAGCTSILVGDEKDLTAQANAAARVNSLLEAVQFILGLAGAR